MKPATSCPMRPGRPRWMLARAGDLDGLDRQGGPEPQPAEQSAFGDGDGGRYCAPQPVDVWLFESTLRASPELAFQRHGFFWARTAPDSRHERATPPELHA